MKKAREKYGDQDEEEKLLRMEVLAVSYYELTVISSAFLLCVSLHEINIGSCVATLQHCDAPPCIIVLLCEQKTESKFCPVKDPSFFLHVKVLQLWSKCTWLSDQLMYMYMYVRIM